ncbi:MAG TPA: LysR family transcriptional regulator [Steroidobacteraceae bacterium]|nr:LysR family transcriptional regulator [Steroidobacteraceae bacterium]
MNLRHLAVFHGVAKAGSVNAAARLLHTSQPAVSRELHTLEERLGVVLFDRMPRGMRLTEAGELLLGYAERIFGLEREAERSLRELADLEGGELAIGASNTLGTYLLPAFLAAFHKRHSKVSLDLEIGNTQEIIKGVLDARFSIGFVEGRVRDDAIEAKEFLRDRIVAVVSSDHALAGKRAVTMRSLAQAPSILREPGSGTREIVERAFARRRLTLRCGLQIGNSAALKQAALEGGGIGWISELCVAEELRSGRLVELRPPHLSLERPLYSLRLRGRHLKHSALAFLQSLQQPALAATRARVDCPP